MAVLGWSEETPAFDQNPLRQAALYALYSQRRLGGFSLVEMMVAITVGGILMIGLTNLLIDTKSVYVREDQFARLQESARIAMQVSARNLRGNRSLGCRSIAMVEREGQFTVKACRLLDTAGGNCGHANWKTDRHFLGMDRAIGYDNADDLAAAASYADLPDAAAENIAARWLRGDVLVTWGVDDQGVGLAGTLAGAIGDNGGFEGTGDLNLDTIPSALANVGRLALITDCVSADLFEISGPEDRGANDSSVAHTATDADGSVVNAADTLSRAYNWSAASATRQVAQPVHRAAVYPFSYDVYYVCCVDTNNRRIQTGAGVGHCRESDGGEDFDRYRPSLCIWSMEDGDSQALVTDVADMRLTFSGVLPDGTAYHAHDSDTVHTAAWVSGNNGWSRVRSASVELLLATEQRGVVSQAMAPAGDNWPPNTGNGDISDDTLGTGLPADGRRYQRFLINVAMRASIPWSIDR
jgi:prepilin-type N-terminal cleavage/methylation domain-containing protein